MSGEPQAPPIPAFASGMYGQYFDDTGTEDKLTASIKAFGAAHEFERRFTVAHLQYLQLQQLGRIELFLAQLVSELRAVRLAQAEMGPEIEDIHQAVIDMAESIVSGQAPDAPPEAPSPLPADPDLPEGVEFFSPPEGEVLQLAPAEAGESAPAEIVRARPMADPDPDS